MPIDLQHIRWVLSNASMQIQQQRREIALLRVKAQAYDTITGIINLREDRHGHAMAPDPVHELTNLATDIEMEIARQREEAAQEAKAQEPSPPPHSGPDCMVLGAHHDWDEDGLCKHCDAHLVQEIA